LAIFAKLQKVTISFVMSVCPSSCMELGSHWMDFNDIWYLSIFQKSSKGIQVLLKPDKNSKYFT
jgi:hypothetical protein